MQINSNETKFAASAWIRRPRDLRDVSRHKANEAAANLSKPPEIGKSGLSNGPGNTSQDK